MFKPIPITVKKETRKLKKTEETLTERKELFRAITETAEDSIFCKDADLKFTFANAAMEKHLDLSRKEIVGMKAEDLFEKKAVRAIKKGDELTFQGKTLNVIRDITFRGTPLTIHTIQVPLRDSNGQVNGICGIIRDITELKAAETEKALLKTQLHQAQKMETIGNLAGGIAHDFNNILGIILSNTELAILDLMGHPEESIINNLEETRTACLRAKGMIHQLLSFSRKTDQTNEPVPISEIVNESISLLRSSLPTTIEIKKELEISSDTILSDPSLIHQTLINLCTNASHAMQKEGGLLTVELKTRTFRKTYAKTIPKLKKGRYAELTVKDTGCGIQEEIIHQIFDPYFTTKEIGKGTGMGLSVVHGIAVRHGGGIRVESAPGKGSIFQVYFPITQSEKTQNGNTPTNELPKGNECILLVDDEEAIVQIAKNILERLGYTVLSYTCSQKAMDTFKTEPEKFDLVISDTTMPDLAGDVLAEKLLKIRPDLPIILSTGFSERINEEKAKNIGVKALFMKPVKLAELAKLVRNVLDGIPQIHPDTE